MENINQDLHRIPDTLVPRWVFRCYQNGRILLYDLWCSSNLLKHTFSHCYQISTSKTLGGPFEVMFCIKMRNVLHFGHQQYFLQILSLHYVPMLLQPFWFIKILRRRAESGKQAKAKRLPLKICVRCYCLKNAYGNWMPQKPSSSFHCMEEKILIFHEMDLVDSRAI